MTSAAEILDRETLEAWLDGKPHGFAVAIAARAALRVIPLWAEYSLTTDARDRRFSSVEILRASLIPAVAAVSPNSDMKEFAIVAAASDSAGRTDMTAVAASQAASAAIQGARATVDPAAAAKGVDEANFAAAAATRSNRAAASRSDINYDRFTAEEWADAAYVWDAVRHDAEALETGSNLQALQIWPTDNPLQEKWEHIRTRWTPDTPYDFWHRWYENLLAGIPMNPDLLYQIALIPNETWDAGPEAVAEAIREIEAEFQSEGDEIEKNIAAMSASAPERIQATKQAMERHRADLPPTLDAILGYISLEVKRLQERNYRDADEEQEAKRQIRTLTTLYRAVEQLQSLIPKTDEMPIEDAKKAEKLARLYLNRFKDWPRDHVDDVVGGVYTVCGEIAGNTIRMGLVAATAFALPMIGVPTPWALGAGIAVFGNKTVAEAAKSVRDSVFPNPS